MKIYLATLLCLCFALSTASAQDKEELERERRIRAGRTAATLINDGLIVFIPTETKKIAAMRELLATGDMTDQNRARLRERLEETVGGVRERGLQMQAAFREIYDVGPVYFLPDTALTQLNERQPAGYFYDDALNIDPNITLPPHYVVVRAGYLDPAVTTGAEALMLTYDGTAPLEKPFPAAVTFNNVGLLFNTMLAEDIAERKRWEAVVRSLTKKLRRGMATLEE